MQLQSFRVRNFRSIEDSGWIDTGDLTALIGTNESGKTNLLIALWKLKPARDGQINPIADYPRSRYGEIRAMGKKPVFIEARFRLSDEFVGQVAEQANVQVETVRDVEVRRRLDGEYEVSFPNEPPRATVSKDRISAPLQSGKMQLQARAPDNTDAQVQLRIDAFQVMSDVLTKLNELPSDIDGVTVDDMCKMLKTVDCSGSPESPITRIYQSTSQEIARIAQGIPRETLSERPDLRDLIVNHLPSFVYYSQYGNLDSEIYLPHVIQNLQRTDLGTKEEARARTLRVLFDFVQLRPEEILELGQEFPPGSNPTEEQIQQAAQRKRERDILLSSASAQLTKKFRGWWKQGDHQFRFHADGSHFRIWVSDDRRPEPIELEGRSAGLQWFLSFYLVFLVESKEAHRGTILLLDEPGHSLHPLGQRDLATFFESLAETNQVIYTTHSPFLIDSNRIDRVRAVYVDESGYTVASANLRAGLPKTDQAKSVYPVHAALGLTVSDTLLAGCTPVVVEGPSDQVYLLGIRDYLLRKGLLKAKRDLVFVPAGGTKGIATTASLLAAREADLPIVILDSDQHGKAKRKELTSGVYQPHPDRIIAVGDVVKMDGAEIEDLYPKRVLLWAAALFFRGTDADTDEWVDPTRPILHQIEQFARDNGIRLDQGWKMKLANRARERLQRMDHSLVGDTTLVDSWEYLFGRFL